MENFKLKKLEIMICLIMIFIFTIVNVLIFKTKNVTNVTVSNRETKIRLLDQNGNALITWYPIDAYTLKDGFCSFTFEGMNYNISGSIIIQTASKK